MKKVLRFRVAACLVFLLCVAMAIDAPAQTFTTLVDFDGTNGANPYGSLVQGGDANLYGTTFEDGTYGSGTVFKITTTGALQTLYSFCAQGYPCNDGAGPYAGLTLARDGNFYGTTTNGGSGAPQYGTVFRITSGGVLTTLYSFCSLTQCSDGFYPYGQLIQGSDGAFYGTTESGGTYGYGTVFKITSSGLLTTLYSLCAAANCTDGAEPYGGLVQATDGNLYGTTYRGGVYDSGTVFKMTTGGVFTNLASFTPIIGYHPEASVIQATDGNFYGTTYAGAANNSGAIFKITPAGMLTTLYSFCSQTGCADGALPFAPLLQATDGNLYGTTIADGHGRTGTAFGITLGGSLITLHNFCSQTGCSDGNYPYAGLLQGTDGVLFGATQYGGVGGLGTVFSLSVGLAPFVETLPTVGKVGTHVIVLGNGLTGATSVTFNSTAATFTVVSPTEIKTTVPIGATSGKVQVTTPHGTLTSNVVFQVK